MDEFIRSCTHYRLIYSLFREAHQIIHIIESCTPLNVILLHCWEPGKIPDWDGYLEILTFLDFIKAFGTGAASGLKEIKSEQVTQWYFGNFLFAFGIPEMIVVDAGDLFSCMSKKL